MSLLTYDEQESVGQCKRAIEDINGNHSERLDLEPHVRRKAI